ncbi:MAG: C1 family peptidase [Acidobacteriota bacterium]
MNKSIFTLIFFLSALLLLPGSPDKKNKLKYEKSKKDPVLKIIKNNRDQISKKKNDITELIVKKNKKFKKSERDKKQTLKADLKGVYPPSSPDEFKSLFHFDPIPQYLTSTCWSFSATSFYESEIFRLKGKKVKLSEMWTVYYELIEKSKGFIKKRGHSLVSGGGETNGVNRIWKKYGIVPASVYSGVLQKDGLHDHAPLMRELKNYLSYIKKNGLWDKEDNIGHIKLILNKHMGQPPSKFEYKGKTYTPEVFLNEVTGLNMDDYYGILSTRYYPFYTKQKFDVPDNWWHSKDYINLPLNVWYGIIKKSILNGYTLVIGGDVSEPGNLGEKDVIFIPTFDIPYEYIDQDSREFRIYNKTTQDDHGIHLVGYKRKKGKDWFLIKDSNRASRKGKFKGYYFFREDFIKLKMLTFTVHKDMLKGILKKLKK